MNLPISPTRRPRWADSCRSARSVAWVVAAAVCAALVALPAASAQIGTGPESAPPLVFNAELDLDKAHSQNWALAQDHRGVLYVGNGDGLLAFDGARWAYDAADLDSSGARERTMRGLALGPSGRLYTGLVDAFGYVDPARGNGFVSLSSALPDSLRDFGVVWTASVLPGAAYFVTDRWIFRVPLPYARRPEPEDVTLLALSDIRAPDGKPLDVPPDAAPFLGFAAGGRFYAHVSGVGLCVATADGLRLLPGGDRLASAGVFGVVPLRARQDSLVAVTSRGLFLHHGEGVEPFGGESSALVRDAEPYIARPDQDGRIAIGTRRGGVLLVNPDGSLAAQVGEREGLQDDNITDLLVDRDGGIWLALEAGIGRVEAASVVGSFSDPSGLRGGPQALIRVPGEGEEPASGRLYVGTPLGLYVLEPATTPGAFATFSPIPTLTSTVWSLLAPAERGGPLLVGTTEGLYRLDLSAPSAAERVWTSPTEAVFALLRDPEDPSLLWVGGSSALFGLRERGGTYEVVHRIETRDSARALHLDGQGDLWVETGATGLLRVDRTGAGPARYGSDEGLPGDLENLFLAMVEGRPLALTEDSVLVYDGALDRFRRDPEWFGDLNASTIVELASGDVLAHAGRDEDYQPLLRYTDRQAEPDTVLTRLSHTILNGLYPEADGTVWALGLGALYRIRPPQRPLPPLHTVLSRVSLLRTDSTLFDGFGLPAIEEPLPYADRALRFAFGAPAYDEPGATTYQVRLEGADDDWGRWTDEPRRDYTNLPAGTYTFMVRSRDVHGRISEPTALPFVVLPPWYRTGWAYALWMALGVASVAGLVRWQDARRAARERELEREVRARTREVQEQTEELSRLNRALSKQAAELRRSNAELWEAGELKAHLLGMAAHDLQTPLTSVLGFSDLLVSELPPDDERLPIARRIYGAADEMRVLIRDLLHSVAAQTGRLQLSIEYVDLCEVAAEAVRRLEAQAHRKGQEIALVARGPAWADADADRVRDAMTNLLSNAVKYAPQNSRIDVRATLEGDRFRFAVTDRGPGLSQQEQDRLFRPFERLSPQPTGGEASSGLGLFLVHEIAQLHGGGVEVESAVGEGSTFTLLLPADRHARTNGSAPRAVPAERQEQ